MTYDLRFLKGDATAPELNSPGVIAHVVNDVPAWGRGFVLALSARYPQPEAAYRSGPPALGDAQIVQIPRPLLAQPLYVANLCAQRGLPGRNNPRPLDMAALECALERLANFGWQAQTSVHLPRIGAGLARGHWPDIETLIRRTLAGLDVTVYDLP